MIKQCVLLDLDGTVADLSHRLHYIKNGNRDWKSFFAEVGKDKPIWQVIDVVRALHDEGHYIVAVSGRSNVCEKETIQWLYDNEVPFDDLYMRQEGDYRPDTIVKEEILHQLREEGYNPWLAIDDRNRLAKMWRSHGIKTFLCDDWEEGPKQINGVNPPKLWVMVGPSGAGKSTYIERKISQGEYKPDWVVSSDQIRAELCGDWKDQSRNDDVFASLHIVVEARLRAGLNCVVDATNLRNKDRKAVVNLAPEGTEVYYVVINRPMEEKVRDGG